MKKNDRKMDQQRRDFLRNSATTGAGVMIAAAVPGVAIAGTNENAKQPTKGNSGYKLSQHIVDYYKSCEG
jgi:nitrous oxide reductase